MCVHDVCVYTVCVNCACVNCVCVCVNYVVVIVNKVLDCVAKGSRLLFVLSDFSRYHDDDITAGMVMTSQSVW